eukprot:10087139-Lingulodinium_polyedra.AAC.1
MAGVAGAGPPSDIEAFLNALPSDDEGVEATKKSDDPQDMGEKHLSEAPQTDDDHAMQQDSPCDGGL